MTRPETIASRLAELPAPRTRRIVVVGAGPAAHRFATALRARDAEAQLVVLGEESHAPYDRVNLAQHWLPGTDLTLPDFPSDERTHLITGARVSALDPDARTVRVVPASTAWGARPAEEIEEGIELAWDELVLATGSSATLPPLPGNDLPGVFVYRSLDDVEAMRARVESLRVPGVSMSGLRAVVIGGGLLGLEAAGGLRDYGFDTHVVHSRDWLMSSQLDEGGGRALNRAIRERGITLHLGVRPTEVLPADAVRAGEQTRTTTAPAGAPEGAQVGAVRLGGEIGPDGARCGGEVVRTDILVWAVGITPRDELARAAGMEVAERGGVPIDVACRTGAPGVWAIGEVASVDGRCAGLVAPANAMAETAAARLCGEEREFTGVDGAAKLKLHGLEVASFGDALSAGPDCLDVVMADPTTGVYQKLVLSDDASMLLGGVFVGDAAAYDDLRPLLGRELPVAPATYLAGGGEVPAAEIPEETTVCSCNGVSAGQIAAAVDDGARDLAAVKACTGAGTRCGSCVGMVGKIIDRRLEAAGIEVSRGICEHFALSRPELYEAVRAGGYRTFTAVVQAVGTGRGCAVCRPAVASILASLYHEHILGGDRGGLQDTNDRFLANMQKDGTYSVIPRVPGGEISPAHLVVLGQVAEEFGLAAKITGAQRIDLLGARVEQLPQIWARLNAAGMESGRAYGKSLRAVKSCVGSDWCRYGVRDSVGTAVELELRYRGLRSPHKIKMGVSGCARECAEARSKDVGVIATEQGWNIYVGGNGGFTPRHAELLVADVAEEDLVPIIDRFLMYYVRTADRLQRTASWIESLDGGIEHVRQVVLEDSLGIAADLEADMQATVEDYEDEWAAVLRDPEQLARFTSFVNLPGEPDAAVRRVPSRVGPRPADPEHRLAPAD